jgi:hypothetical protein
MQPQAQTTELATYQEAPEEALSAVLESLLMPDQPLSPVLESVMAATEAAVSKPARVITICMCERPWCGLGPFKTKIVEDD